MVPKKGVQLVGASWTVCLTLLYLARYQIPEMANVEVSRCLQKLMESLLDPEYILELQNFL